MRARRVFKITVWSLLGLVATVLVAVGGVATWAIVSPRSAWSFTEKHFLPKDLHITWHDLQGDWHKRAWNQWSFELEIQNLAVTKETPQVDVGVETIALKFDWNFFSAKPFLEFDVLQVRARDGSSVHLAESEDTPGTQSPFQQMQTYLGYLAELKRSRRVDTIEISVPHFSIAVGASPPLVFSAKVGKSADDVDSLVVQGELRAEPTTVTLDALLSPMHLETPDTFLRATVGMKAPSVTVTTDLTAIYNGGALTLETQPKVTIASGKKPMTLSPKIKLAADHQAATITAGDTAVLNIPGPIVKLDRVDATVRVPFTDGREWSRDPATYRVWSGVDLFLIDKDMRPPLEKACHCKLPEKFQVSAEGRAWLDTYFGKDKKGKQKILDSVLKIESVKNKLFLADVSAKVAVFRQNTTWLFEPVLDSSVDVESFQGVRAFLDAKGVLIPAPLNVLEGKMHFTARAPVTEDEKQFQTVADLTIDLSSPTQKVAIDTHLTLTLLKTFKHLGVKVDTLVKTVRLELPPIDPVRGIPPITPDARVLRKPPVKNKKPSNFVVTVDAQVRTEKPGAIQLLSKYADPNVPVTVDVHAEDKDIAGLVKLEPFAIVYLRRRVEIESLGIKLAAGADPATAPLSGRMHIDQGGYRIFIDFGGTLSAPSYVMSSDPYLNKSDIISVLLYGRPNDELVSGEAETAGSFNAALADRAIGLFGLWAFASTPIQSFSYDATHKTYTATVKLADGLTAGIGTNWEKATNFELRQRLSRRWVVTASWLPNEEGTGQESRLVLRWEYRF